MTKEVEPLYFLLICKKKEKEEGEKKTHSYGPLMFIVAGLQQQDQYV